MQVFQSMDFTGLYLKAYLNIVIQPIGFERIVRRLKPVHSHANQQHLKGNCLKHDISNTSITQFTTCKISPKPHSAYFSSLLVIDPLSWHSLPQILHVKARSPHPISVMRIHASALSSSRPAHLGLSLFYQTSPLCSDSYKHNSY